MKKVLAFVLLLALPPLWAAVGPEQLIRETSEQVIDEIRRNGDTYRQEPARIHQLVEALVLPHFDFSAMTWSDVSRISCSGPTAAQAGGKKSNSTKARTFFTETLH